MRKFSELVFATGNTGKIKEAKIILGESVHLKSLADIGWEDDIPETGNSFHENALQKAQFIADKYGIPCFAEDSGLEVDALGGAPGIYSARYAGEVKNDQANNQKLLKELEGITDRQARFRCAIALISGSDIYFFEGTVEGKIAEKPSGKGGFGYDPLFIPQGYDKTFAELDPSEKSRFSHRGEAMRKLAAYLGMEQS